MRIWILSFIETGAWCAAEGGRRVGEAGRGKQDSTAWRALCCRSAQAGGRARAQGRGPARFEGPDKIAVTPWVVNDPPGLLRGPAISKETAPNRGFRAFLRRARRAQSVEN